MQTKKVVENSGNVPENVPLTQVEDDMSDIPGIRVSMATIVELSPLEEQQKLFDENAPIVSEKIIDEIFSSIITLPEGQQQINPSEVQNQHELQPTELTEVCITNEKSDVPPIIDVTNKDNKDNETILMSETSVITENINKSNENLQNIQNSQNSSSSQRVQPIIIDQDIFQQSSEQKSEQFVNDKIVQVSPVVNETVPSIEVSQPQQLQQLSIPLVQNASGATSDDVQQMVTFNTSSDDCKNVPSPSSTLTTLTDTIKKAHSIEDKLFNNNEGEAVVQNQQNINVQQRIKRPHKDSYSSQDSRDEDSYNRHDIGRYNDYERDSKRAAYDSGTSHPEYDSSSGGGGGVGGGSGSYGLGSEEHRSHYGSHYEHSQGSIM